jgi:hypothetical protein
MFTCPVCQQQFGRTAAQLRHDQAKYCSAAFKYAAMRTSGCDVDCVECGRRFYSPSNGNELYCSRDCYKAAVQRNATSYPKIGDRHAHRVVMEEQLQRPLGPDEIVHHRDEDKRNYDLGNLQLTDRPDHFRMHLPRQQSPEHVRKRVESRARTLAAKAIAAEMTR